MRKSQPRAGHVRHERRGSFARAIAALTVFPFAATRAVKISTM